MSLVSRQEGNTPAVGMQRGSNICGQTTQMKRETKIDFQLEPSLHCEKKKAFSFSAGVVFYTIAFVRFKSE